MLRQCFEVVDQVSQVVVADVPAWHVCIQLRAIGVFTFCNCQAKFFRIELAFQG